VRLTDSEKHLFDKLGFEINGEHIERKKDHGELHYAGFNMYISENNHLFEKVGNQLIEYTDERLEAENRFIAKYLHSAPCK